MNKNLKEKIDALSNAGKSRVEIREELKCSASTICYHLNPKTKISTQQRAKRAVKSGKKKEYYKAHYTGNARAQLGFKISQFHRLGHRKNKIQLDRNFTTDDLLLHLGDNPVCYLSGVQIDLSQPSTYSLDHKIPVSKGGESTIANLGLCRSDINRAKNDKTPEEFLALCKELIAFTLS